MNSDEAKKWLRLGFETYGLEGLMDVAAAIGMQPRRGRAYSDGQAVSRRQQLSSPLFKADWGRFPFAEMSDLVAPQLAANKSDCIEKCYRILERPLPSPGSDKNTWDFHKCVNECMGLS